MKGIVMSVLHFQRGFRDLLKKSGKPGNEVLISSMLRSIVLQ